MARISKDHVQYFFEYNIDLSTKTLYLGYGNTDDVELDHKVAADIIKGLHLLENVRPEEPILVIINCEGGSVDHGLAIYDSIRNSKCQVIGKVVGMCHSMAAWVLQACDIRQVTRSSSIMIHDGQGPKNKFVRQQDLYCRDIMLERIRQKHPDFSATKLQKLLDVDTYLTAQEAVELGLADEVIV
jgi:ATP-dependent Clp protease protease subunit